MDVRKNQSYKEEVRNRGPSIGLIFRVYSVFCADSHGAVRFSKKKLQVGEVMLILSVLKPPARKNSYLSYFCKNRYSKNFILVIDNLEAKFYQIKKVIQKVNWVDKLETPGIRLI